MPAVDTTADDGLLHTLISYASSYVGATLLGTIPAPIFQILAGFSNLIWRLVAGVSNDPTSWTSTVLPPLIALFAAYLSLVMAYRTLRSTILLIWWGIKWGAIIGAGIALWAWWTGNQDAINSVGETPGTAAGLASWAGGLAGLNGAATLATTLPLLSRLYGAATQDRPATTGRGTPRSGGRSASSRSRQGARGQSVFDSLDDEDTTGQGAAGRTDAEALLSGVLNSAGSFYRSATSGGPGRQRKTRSTAETVADLFQAANGGESRGAGSSVRGNRRGASPEGEGQGDILGGLLSSIGLDGLMDVAQGVSDEGDQSQMSRWLNMIRETVNEANGQPAGNRQRTPRARRRSSWFSSGSGEDSDLDEEDDDDDADFVLDDADEDGSSGDWPWSASRRRGPAYNTRSKRTSRSGRRA